MTFTHNKFIRSLPLLVLLSLSFPPPRARLAAAQNVSFDGLLENKVKAVMDLSVAAHRALAKKPWCDAAKDCTAAPCLMHRCSGALGKHYKCDRNLSLHSCPALNDIHVCTSGKSPHPSGTLINSIEAAVLTPDGSATSSGDNQSVTVADRNLRRDVCALKQVSSKLIELHKRNKLRFWTYVGTTHGAFLSFPSVLVCRDKDQKDDPFAECGFQPKIRPWYITAASGPRDVVFLFDRTSLTGATQSRLRHSLKEALRTFDSRDSVAVVAFDSDNVKMLSDNDGLVSGTTEAINSLQDSLEGLSDAEGAPNVTLAFDKAFDLLYDAAAKGESSKCARYIVLMTGGEDECFKSCTTTSSCRCVSMLQAFIKERQDERAKGEEPTTILTFTELPNDDVSVDYRNNIERMSKTIVCDREASGIWRRVLDSDSESNTMLTFYEIVASKLYESVPVVFSSQLYKDNSGLGEMFTLAVPIYESDERRLVGVAGLDVTLAEVTEIVASETEARRLIEERSFESRKCVAPEPRDACALQRLRAAENSALCANKVLDSEACHRFGSDIYKYFEEEKTFEDAKSECEALGEGSSLAVVNTATKSEVLSALCSSDGSWIGLSAPEGDNLTWVDGSEAGEWQFPPDGLADVPLVQEHINGDVGVTVDRRGVRENWNVVAASAKRSYVCQVGAQGAQSAMVCPKINENGEEGQDKLNPSESDCRASVKKPARSCSTTENEQMDNVNPFCNQTNNEHSSFDRKCCGGGADRTLPPETETKDDGLSTRGIIGIGIGIVGLLVIISCVVVGYCVLRRRREKETETHSPEPTEAAVAGEDEKIASENGSESRSEHSIGDVILEPIHANATDTNGSSSSSRYDGIYHVDHFEVPC